VAEAEATLSERFLILVGREKEEDRTAAAAILLSLSLSL